MQAQWKEIVERDGIWRAIPDYANQRSTQHTTISDIVDGAEYKKLKENGGILTQQEQCDIIPVYGWYSFVSKLLCGLCILLLTNCHRNKGALEKT